MEEENTERPLPVQRDPYPDLRALRESQGKTLKDISQKTRIRVAYLEAIEQNRFQFLPEPTYAENFIRTYAHELGLRGDAILSRYRKYLRDLAGREEEQIAKDRQSRERRSVTISRWFRERLPAIQLSGHRLKILTWTVSVLLAVSAAFLIVTHEGPDSDISRTPAVSSVEAPPPAGGTETPPVPAGKEAEPAAPVPAPAPQEAKPELPPAGAPLTLVITAKETTWIRIVEDQEISSQFLLRPGERVERQARQSFDLDVGNAGGIDVEFQGRPIGSIGKSGEVVHLTLPDARGQ